MMSSFQISSLPKKLGLNTCLDSHPKRDRTNFAFKLLIGDLQFQCHCTLEATNMPYIYHIENSFGSDSISKSNGFGEFLLTQGLLRSSVEAWLDKFDS